jgi:AcrR family transcriptional regulator
VTGLRERKKQQTRAAILRQAEALFREQGFEATRVRQIHEPIEISEPTFFKYFPSKQAVLDEIALAWLRDVTAAWPRASPPGDDQGPPLAQLGRLFRPLIAAIERDRSFTKLLLTRASLWNPRGAMAGKHAEPGHPLHEATRAGFDAMADFFAAAQERGEIRGELDPHQLAEVAFGVFRTTLQLWATDYWKSDHELEARLTAAFEVLWNGMGATR